MDLITLVIILIIIGAAVYIVPMDPQMKNAIFVIVLVVVALILLRSFVPSVRIGGGG